MKVSGLQVPNMVVYAMLYLTIFGISIWLLVAHEDSRTDWLLYSAMIGSVLAGLIKFGVHSLPILTAKRNR
jgi:hypothetical protein